VTVSNPVRIFLAGEGPGVLHALLRKVQTEGWIVVGATSWKNIRKLRVGGAREAEAQNVRGAALDAREAEADVLAFVRDEDGNGDRTAANQHGISEATQAHGSPAIVGGMAVPKLEGWLALLGEGSAAPLSPMKAERMLADHGVNKETAAMVVIVEEGDLVRACSHSKSLQAWVNRARAVLPMLVEQR
jgi:hypothetical protein